MYSKFLYIFGILVLCTLAFAQDDGFRQVRFLEGRWEGTGSGFGNQTSIIKSEFQPIMGRKYILVKNDSKFAPTDSRPEGEHHMDWGMISYDTARKLLVYRQFNIEGYVNRYVLVDSLSTDNKLVFLTEDIENFVRGGKARITINKISDNQIETVFDVSLPGKDYACFGTNHLIRQ